MSSDNSETIFTLPDILAEWPWKRTMNPHASTEMKAESLEWIQTFVSAPHMRRVFELGDFSSLCFLAYNQEDKDALRVACDFMNWFFLYDEQSDLMTPHEAQELANIVLDTMNNPEKERPADENVIGEALRQLWKRASEYTSVTTLNRFIKSLGNCTIAIVQQAQDRASGYIRDMDEYLPLRRETLGAKPAFAILEFQLNLPDEVFEAPVIQRLINTCVDLIVLSNDIYSYNVEQSRGDEGHNLVTILMEREHLTLTEAMTWIGNYASECVHSFLNDLEHVPSFGEAYQADVERYLNGLGNFVRANDCWHFESGRYFGIDGLAIQQNRKVVLLHQK